MALSFPPLSSPAWETLDRPHVEEVARRYVELPTLGEARRRSVRQIAESDGAIRSVETLVLRANGTLSLLRIGPRGGFSEVWNFGSPLAA